MPKSTLKPMNSTAKATEIRFNSPIARAAKPAVQMSPAIRVTRVAATKRSERSPITRNPATRAAEISPTRPMPSRRL